MTREIGVSYKVIRNAAGKLADADSLMVDWSTTGSGGRRPSGMTITDAGKTAIHFHKVVPAKRLHREDKRISVPDD